MSAWMKPICIGAFKPWVSDYPLSFWILSKTPSHYISHARLILLILPALRFISKISEGVTLILRLGSFWDYFIKDQTLPPLFFSLFFYQGGIREEVRGLDVRRKPTTSEAHSTECFLVCWSIRALHWARELNIPSPLTKHNKPSVSLSSVSCARRRYRHLRQECRTQWHTREREHIMRSALHMIHALHSAL